MSHVNPQVLVFFSKEQFNPIKMESVGINFIQICGVDLFVTSNFDIQE